MTPEKILKTDILVHKDVLHLLVLTESFLEYIQIPLDGRPEVYEEKVCYPLDGCLCLCGDTVRAYVVTKEGVYVHKGEFIPLEIEGGRIKAKEGLVILVVDKSFLGFKRSEIIRVEEGGISSLGTFPRVLEFDMSSSFIFFRTTGGVSIYSLVGIPYLRDYKAPGGVFLENDRMVLEDGGCYYVYRILKGSIEQTKRIRHLPKEVGRISLSPLTYSGKEEDGYVFYRDGVVYRVQSLITSFVEYRGCLFCCSKEMLYFLPREKDSNIQLTGTERIAMANILENKFSPFVTRTFDDVDDINVNVDDLDVQVDMDCGFVKTKALHTQEGIFLPERIFIFKDSSENGLFLSLLAYQGFRIQTRKMVCNTLAYIKKTGKGLDTLKILDLIMKWGDPRAFEHLRIDFPRRLYDSFSRILKDIHLPHLLLRFLEVKRVGCDLEGEAFEILRGIERYRKGDRIYEDGSRRVGTNVLPFFFRILDKNRDIPGILHLYKSTGYFTHPSTHPSTLFRDIHHFREIYGVDEPPSLEIFLRTQEDYKWYVEFLKGEYFLLSPLKIYSKFISLEYPEGALDFFYRTGDYRRVARLLHKRKKKERKYMELVGDYVFVDNHHFVSLNDQ